MGARADRGPTQGALPGAIAPAGEPGAPITGGGTIVPSHIRFARLRTWKPRSRSME